MKQLTGKLLLAACVGLALTGCKNESIKQMDTTIDTNVVAANTHITTARSPASFSRSAINVHTSSWLPSSEILIEDVNRPGRHAEMQHITVRRTFDSLESIAERLTQITGIPVVVERSSADPVAATGSTADNLQRNSLPILPPGGTLDEPVAFDPSMFNMPPAGGSTSGSPSTLFSASYEGTLKGFLDIVAARYSIGWGWNNNASSIRLFTHDTRTFRLASLIGDTSFSTSVASEGGTMTGIEYSGLSVWSDVEAVISTMLSENGSFSVTPSIGAVTVNDTPTVLDKVEAYIKNINDTMGTQVLVNVQVLSVETSRNDGYGINWDLAFQNIAQTYGLTFASSFSPIDGATNVGATILQNSTRPDAGVNRWTGSNAVVSALSSQGKVSQMTSAAVTTLNNQTVPVNIGRTQSYLASTDTTVSDGVATTSLTPGQVNSGFSMTVTPLILSEKEVMLQFGAEIASIISIDAFSSGGQTIQIPNVEQRSFLQRVRINSGDTLVLAGFENDLNNTGTQGIGRAENTLLGGGASGASRRNAIVILIQPIVYE